MDTHYQGAWTALVTPFKDDFSVDWAALERNVMFQVEQGMDGLLSMGTTGESATVTHNEHSKITANVIAYVNGRCKILAGTGSNSTEEAVFETERAAESGASACLLVDCYYNKPSSLELRREYYSVLCERFPDIDFIAYAIPGRSVTVISPEDLAILDAEYDNLVAVKEATGDFERMRLTRELAPELTIMSGDDPNTYTMMTDTGIGASGAISVISNLAPKAVAEYVGLINSGDPQAAKKIDDALAPLFNIVGMESAEKVTMPNGSVREVTYKFPNPLPIKAMMAGLGMMDVRCKRPMGRLSSQAVAKVRKALAGVNEDDPQILSPIGEFYGVDIAERLADDAVWKALSY